MRNRTGENRNRDWKQEAIEAVGKLDDKVRPCKAQMPDDVADALTHAIEAITSDMFPTNADTLKFGVVVMKNLYRAGYQDGLANSVLHPTGGKG